MKLYQKVLTQNDQTDNKSSSNYLFQENRLLKTSNYTMEKTCLVQKSYAACRTEYVGRRKITKQVKY